MRRFLNKSDCGASLERLASSGDSMALCMGALELIPYGRLRRRAEDPGTKSIEGVGGLLAGDARPGPLIAARVDLPEILSLYEQMK